jgi:tyrosine-protein phosphatase non-receptor type 23
MITAPDEKSIVDELQRLVDKVEEMKTQRALLMLQLRESLRDDDITDQIAHNDEEKNAFSTMVQKEISKHQNVVRLKFFTSRKFLVIAISNILFFCSR